MRRSRPSQLGEGDWIGGAHGVAALGANVVWREPRVQGQEQHFLRRRMKAVDAELGDDALRPTAPGQPRRLARPGPARWQGVVTNSTFSTSLRLSRRMTMMVRWQNEPMSLAPPLPGSRTT
jgi:hypothetical protein